MMLTKYTDEKRELLIDKDHISVYAFNSVFGSAPRWRIIGELEIVQDLGDEFIVFSAYNNSGTPFHVWKKDLSIVEVGPATDEICLLMKYRDE